VPLTGDAPHGYIVYIGNIVCWILIRGARGLLTRKRILKMPSMFVKRLHRDHSSLVLTIPMPMRKYLDVKAGDYVVLQPSTDNRSVNMQKFVQGGIRDGEAREAKDVIPAAISPR